MSDLISRQDAIDAVTRAIWHYPNECYKNLNTYEVAEALVSDAIKSLPSAEPKTAGWIPCSERLPEYREVVLITNYKGNVRYGQFRGTREKYWYWKGNTLEEVIAWMPLPEPYKGGDTE